MKALRPVPALSAAAALGMPGAVVIDLRSPGEFAADHVPGATNVPLFDDAARALIGLLYRRASPQVAFEQGRRVARESALELVESIARSSAWTPPAGELPRLVDELTRAGIAAMESELALAPLEQVPERAVVLMCFRGGLRSRSVAALLRALGLERAVIVQGGYKSYRAMVLERLAAWDAPRTFVLRGLTGVGKTLVLRELRRLRPSWTLDLEDLARHRSSILGGVGLEPTSQRWFESRLVARIDEGFEGPLVVEGESRKVGDVIVPRNLWRALDGGTNLELVADTARRVDVLVEDYLTHPTSLAELQAPLAFLEERLKLPTGRLAALLDAHRERELVEILLERYYDPLYRHSEQGRHSAASFDSTDPARCAAEIAEWIEGPGAEKLLRETN